MSRKNPEHKPESAITEAAERAGVLIRGLQNRLNDCAPNDSIEESTEDLEWELQKTFAAASDAGRFPLDQIRERVIEGIAEKILRGWEWQQDGKTAPLENEVVERLIERVLERMVGARSEAGARSELDGRPARALASPSKSAARLSPTQFPS